MGKTYEEHLRDYLDFKKDKKNKADKKAKRDENMLQRQVREAERLQRLCLKKEEELNERERELEKQEKKLNQFTKDIASEYYWQRVVERMESKMDKPSIYAEYREKMYKYAKQQLNRFRTKNKRYAEAY